MPASTKPESALGQVLVGLAIVAISVFFYLQVCKMSREIIPQFTAKHMLIYFKLLVMPPIA
jgi:hypothetical protein